MDQDLLPTADGSIFQAIGRPPSPYPPGKIVDTVADNDPFGMLEGMERQQTSELICMERSPSESSSVFYDHDGLTAWSGPDRTSPASDQSDHGSFGLLPIPLEDTSSCRSVSRDLLFTFDLGNNVYPTDRKYPRQWESRTETTVTSRHPKFQSQP